MGCLILSHPLSSFLHKHVLKLYAIQLGVFSSHSVSLKLHCSVRCLPTAIHVRACAQIAGFVFARSGVGNGMCTSIVGSKSYMAPEIISRTDSAMSRDMGYNGAKVGIGNSSFLLPPPGKVVKSISLFQWVGGYVGRFADG